MKIQTTAAQAWWIALIDEIRAPEGLDVAVAFKAMKERFDFATIPTAAAQGGGFEFVTGALRDTKPAVVITKIGIYNDGLSVDVPSNTENAELVLQKTLELCYSFGVRKPVTPPLHYYLSTIVADFDYSLDALIPSSLLERIGTALPIKGKAQFSGFNINIDKTEIPGRYAGINPTLFNIHRRIDVPYEQNRYFSQANMTTKDHLALLAEFESLAAKAK